MNGRVYDPLLARFGTPDPMTENPFSTQGWNRYSYVGNSPVNFTDPSGYCFLGCFWKPIFKAIGKFLRQSWRAIVQIAAAVLCAPAGLSSVCAAVASAVVTGITSGNLGLALRAGLISMVTAGAMKIAGDLTSAFPGAPDGGHAPLIPGSEAHLFNIAAHALVGCASSVASGGKCGPGALSGAAGSLVGPFMKGMEFTSRLVVQGVAGGLASVAGGGKFANGAVTAAFGYLFNEAGGGDHCSRGYCDEAGRPLMAEPQHPTMDPMNWVQCLTACANEQFGIQSLFGAGAVGAGLPILDKGRSGFGGTSTGTSIASKYLSELFPGEAARSYPAPTAKNLFAQSRVYGRILGRWVPVVGTGILLYDGVNISYCTYNCVSGGK